MQRSGDMKSSMIWLVLAYFFHTTGELCISPVGLSMITKLAPLRLGSLMMGVWFLVNLFGNTLAGYIGAFTENMGQYPWMMRLAGDVGVRPEHAGLLGVFGGLAVVLLAFSVVLWAISGRIVGWMHGAEEIRRNEAARRRIVLPRSAWPRCSPPAAAATPDRRRRPTNSRPRQQRAARGRHWKPAMPTGCSAPTSRPDTEALAAKADERCREVYARLIRESKALRRQGHVAGRRAHDQAPEAEPVRARAGRSREARGARRASRRSMVSMYGAGKYCPKGRRAARTSSSSKT